MPQGFSRLQIALHWVVFLLIVAQFVFHEPISDAWEALSKGQEVDPSPLVGLHVFGGILILALVVLRLYVRLTRGAPALPAEEPAPLKFVAHITHWALYALMLLLPLSGIGAWFAGAEQAAEVHETFKGLLLILVLLHVLGALFQQFVLKTNIMERMKRPG